MNKKVILSVVGVSIIPLIIFFSVASIKIKDSDKSDKKILEAIKETRNELMSEISLKNARYIEALLKKAETDVSTLKFQTEILMSKKDKNLDLIEKFAKRSLMTSSIAEKVFIETSLFSSDYHRNDVQSIIENDKKMFFDLVNIKNNPAKKILWSDVYSDEEDNKFTSCVAPVYNKNKFEGFVSIEINVGKVTDKLLNKDFKYKDSYAYVIGKKTIIGYSAKATDDLNLDAFNKIEKSILKVRNGKLSVKLNEANKTIFFSEINPVKWIFCFVVPDTELDFKGIAVSSASFFSRKNLFVVFLIIFCLTVSVSLFISKRLVLAHDYEVGNLIAKLAMVNQEFEDIKEQFETHEVIKSDKQKLEGEYKKLTDTMRELRKFKEESEVKIRNYVSVLGTSEKEKTDLKKNIQELQKKIDDLQAQKVEQKQVQQEKIEPKQIEYKQDEFEKKKPVPEIQVIEKQKIETPEKQVNLSAITDDVLIIEASEGNLKEKRMEVFKIGYSIHLARGVDDAIEKINTSLYKFVIIDISLNDDDKKKIRKNIVDVPVIDSDVSKDEFQSIIDEAMKKRDKYAYL